MNVKMNHWFRAFLAFLLLNFIALVLPPIIGFSYPFYINHLLQTSNLLCVYTIEFVRLTAIFGLWAVFIMAFSLKMKNLTSRLLFTFLAVVNALYFISCLFITIACVDCYVKPAFTSFLYSVLKITVNLYFLFWALPFLPTAIRRNSDKRLRDACFYILASIILIVIAYDFSTGPIEARNAWEYGWLDWQTRMASVLTYLEMFPYMLFLGFLVLFYKRLTVLAVVKKENGTPLA